MVGGDKTMELKDIIKFQLKRVNPFQGLVIDADTWRDAHNYHREQQRLHMLAFHKIGINLVMSSLFLRHSITESKPVKMEQYILLSSFERYHPNLTSHQMEDNQLES